MPMATRSKSGYLQRAVAVCATVMCLAALLLSTVVAASDMPEKWELKFGFIKLTDMVPLAVAYEKGFFEDEELTVTLEAQANWKVLFDRVSSGELDGAHMLAAMPLGTATGALGNTPIVTPFTMSYNGAAITVSNEVWAQMRPGVALDGEKPKHPVSAASLKPVLESYAKSGKNLNLGMTFPVGTHNYMLRYWLAAGGINPGIYAPEKGDSSGTVGAQAFLSVVPPPQMVPTMEAGTTAGYCVGEPWNQQAVAKGLGVPVITSEQIWAGGADKVFGIREDFYTKYPNTTIRVVKALIRASHWLDANNNGNRPEAVKMIARPIYVGADEKVIANSMTGTFEFEKGDRRAVPEFNTFFKDVYGIPYYSDAIWWMTQMRRWGHITTQQPDNWYMDMAKKAYRPDVYLLAVKELIAEGTLQASDFPDLAQEDFVRAPQASLLDGAVFDALKPNEFIGGFAIGLKGE